MGEATAGRDIDELFAEIAPLAERFHDAGYAIYLVGGIVRNHLANVHVDLDDVDLTTDAEPADIKKLVGNWFDALWTQGERFGTIGGKVGDRVYEITTHRAEVYQSDSRKPSVEFSKAIADDLSRRDFTVNAMAWTVPGRELIDPYGGEADLAAGILRTPLDADVSFSDDPLRMLRAARFLTRFGLVADPPLLESARSLAGRLDIVSVERIAAELEKLLVLPDPAVGLTFLLEHGLSAQFWPELDAGAIDRIGRITSHGAEVFDQRLAAGMVGIESSAVRARLKHLRVSNDRVKLVVRLAESATSWSRRRSAHDDEAVRRLVARMGDSMPVLLSLGEQLRLPHAAELVVNLDRLGEAGELDGLGPELTGEQLMELLDLGPGPMVGEVLAELNEFRLVDGKHSRDVVEDHARRFWRKRSSRE